MSALTPVQPAGWLPPVGYSNGVLATPGRLLFVAGQIGWDAEHRLVSDVLQGQFRQALSNVLSVVRAAGGRPTDVARLTIYVTDRADYLAARKAIGRDWRDLMGTHYPAMALVEVASLLEPGALVELEATAVV
jgi:enamine deaminase RidA (YjgF/YER057c/UK114 family)